MILWGADVGEHAGRSERGALGVGIVSLGSEDHIGKGFDRLAEFRVILGRLGPDFEGFGGEIDLVVLRLVEDAGFFVIEIPQALLVTGGWSSKRDSSEPTTSSFSRRRWTRRFRSLMICSTPSAGRKE